MIPFFSSILVKALHKLTNYDSHLFIKEKFNQKDLNVNLSVIPQTDESFSCITYGWLEIFDRMNSVQYSLDTKGKALDQDDFNHTKRMEKNRSFSLKQHAYTCEYFKELEDCDTQKPEPKNGHCFPEPKGNFQSDEKTAGTNKIIQELTLKTCNDSTMVFCKSDTLLSADALSKVEKVSFETSNLHALYCVSLPGYIYGSKIYESNRNVENYRDKEMNLRF